jgi:hypothetical protein
MKKCKMFLFFYIGHGGKTNMNKQVLLGTDGSIEQALNVKDILRKLATVEVCTRVINQNQNYVNTEISVISFF